MERGFVFEYFYKTQQVCARFATVQENVEMVGHKTVGVKVKASLRGLFLKRVKHPSRHGIIPEMGRAT